MELIYRAQILRYTPRAPEPYCKPGALNWRYQVPGETYNGTSRRVTVAYKPRAINWRFQMAMGEVNKY